MYYEFGRIYWKLKGTVEWGDDGRKNKNEFYLKCHDAHYTSCAS